MNIAYYYSKDFLYIFPEMYLFLVILSFLMFGVFYTPRGIKLPSVVSILSKVMLLVFILMAIMYGDQYNSFNFVFGGRFIVSNYNILMKFFLIFFLFIFFLMSADYYEKDIIKSYEFVIIILLAVFGMFVMLSAFDFMTMYLALELQTICFYILAAYKSHTNSSTEAGIKYFVLGSFSSGLILFGISLIYGFCATTNFLELSYIFLAESSGQNGMIILGTLFILVGLLFKLGAAPFHMWLPDVYEGSSTIVTGFFASVTKIPAVVLFMIVIYFVLSSLKLYWHDLLLFSATISLAVGSLGALYQNRIKRLMAYSGISHMGFLLLGISTGTLQGVQAMSIYIFIYLLLTVNFFAVLFSIRKYINYHKLSTLEDLRPLFKTNPTVAVMLSLNLFSYAGIPPLAGFFGKFYILSSMTTMADYIVVGLAILFSTISSVYYIRLIKLMFFEKLEKWALYMKISPLASFAIAITSLLNLFFLLFMSPVIVLIQNALYLIFF